MKILHTSDWHLGHTIAGYDRTEEQQQMLDQMVAIVREQQPDVFLLSGDVYHTSQPTTAVQTMFNKTIVRLHDACPSMTIIVTAGNHDSGSKHEIFRTPWEYLNVYMVGSFRKDNPSSHIIEVPHKGYVIAVPYTYERNLQGGVIQQILDETNARNTDDLPIILSAHTSISGANFAGHDNSDEKTIGGIDAIEVAEIGEGYDYLALGHIHHEQFVHTGKHNARYSGSPLPVSFDENYEHSVTIIDVAQHGAPLVYNTIAITNPRPLTTLPTEGTASWEDAKELLIAFPDDLPNYIRLNVAVDDTLPVNARQEAIQIAQAKHCRFCVFNAVKTKTDYQATAQLSVQEFQQMPPIDVARMYAKDMDLLFDNGMQQLFEEVIQTLTSDE